MTSCVASPTQPARTLARCRTTLTPLPPSQAARKRLIALHLAAPVSSSTALTTKGKGTKTVFSVTLSKETGIDLLVEYLDTFYSDAEGWSQLAAAYAELGLYVSIALVFMFSFVLLTNSFSAAVHSPPLISTDHPPPPAAMPNPSQPSRT